MEKEEERKGSQRNNENAAPLYEWLTARLAANSQENTTYTIIAFVTFSFYYTLSTYAVIRVNLIFFPFCMRFALANSSTEQGSPLLPLTFFVSFSYQISSEDAAAEEDALIFSQSQAYTSTRRSLRTSTCWRLFLEDRYGSKATKWQDLASLSLSSRGGDDFSH